MMRIEAIWRKASVLGEAFPIFRQFPASVQPSEGPLDDPALGQDDERFDLIHTGHRSVHSRPKLRPLIASIGVELEQKGKGAEQGRHQQDAAGAILSVGAVHDGVDQETLRVDENVPLLAFDLFARVIAMRIDAGSPFFPRRDALVIDDRGGGAGLRLSPFTAFHIKRFVDARERAVVAPQIEILVKCGARRQILRDRAPLAVRAQQVHQYFNQIALVPVSPIAASLRGGNERPQKRPFRVRQIAGITQLAPVMPGSVLARPHRRASKNGRAS
jgi:hypothetical protein